MGKISRRGLFGWLGAFAVAGPFAAQARPTRLVNAFADYTPLPRYDLLWGAQKIGPGMRVRLPTDYAPLAVGDRITMNGKPWGHVTAVSDDV